ncbi:hypothetical protein L596_029364 [Steinernema carpocapsae]|uniref:Cytochrome P450 n=1 Tax=Steinernema carpocapsae TaxID=34508 RepID=A0A4U5LUF4_STECR|nr:hypothetical protein L596_029364 [Steinernema carpocapsae]
MAALYVVLAFVALVAYLWKSISRKDLPPGPPPLPIIGNTHQFIYGSLKGKTNVQVMKEWRKTYGPVYTMWLGPMPVVLTCDYKTSMEAFVNHGDAQSDRPDTFCFTKMRNRLGLIFSTGPGWQEQRRFSMQTLRDFGFGKNIMQQRILEEANFRFGFWDKLIEESEKGYIVTNPQNYIDLIVGSIINVLIVGYRYDDVSLSRRSYKGMTPSVRF